MAFAPKIDYCGLVVATKPSTQGATSPLVIRDANENVSVEKYQPNGQDGSFVGTEIFGQDSAPSNSYGLQADMNIAAGAIKLNKITTIGEGASAKKYALESFEITTAAGSAPAISATCQEIEAGATDAGQCVYSVPAFTLLAVGRLALTVGGHTLSVGMVAHLLWRLSLCRRIHDDAVVVVGVCFQHLDDVVRTNLVAETTRLFTQFSTVLTEVARKILVTQRLDLFSRHIS